MLRHFHLNTAIRCFSEVISMANTHMFTEESVKVVKRRTFARLGCVQMGKESSF